MTNYKNVPVLRFKEFESEWEVTAISKTLSIGSGRDYKHLENGKIPVYGSGGYMLSVNKYLHEGESVCIGRKGTIDKPIYLNEKFWTVDTLFYTHTFINTIPYFVFLLFNRINWYKYNEASGVPSLSKSTISKIKINLPTKPEQQKIANFLTATDTKIQQLRQKKGLLNDYKKGVMQQIFKQEIRFKNDDGGDFEDWETVQLKDVLSERKTRNSKNKYDEVFSVAKTKGVINQIEHLGRSYASSNISNYKVVFPNDIVYTKSPTSNFPYGIIKQNQLDRTGVVSVLYAVLKPKNRYLGFILHNYFLIWQNTYNYLHPLVHKGAKNTMNINNTIFLNGRKMKLPTSEAEQQKIANFLSSIDEQIGKVSEEIGEMERYKKGLLQGMFV
jgi:type I restriction enzyme S subunit